MRKFKNFIIILLIEILLISGCSYNNTAQENANNNNHEIILSETVNHEKPATKTKNILNNQGFQEINKDELKVYFIDVGQGDATLLEYKNHYMIIDAGNNSEEEFMVEYLNSKNIDTLDYIIGTHPHADHIGGLDAVIDNFDIENIYMPTATTDTKTFTDVLDSIENKHLSITEPVAGTEFMFNDLNIQILSPIIEYDKMNNNSIVLKLTYDDISFLFTGDAEEVAEYDILNLGYNISSDVLKVGHHGSDTSTSDKFLNAVNPGYSVISVGKNSYGHPAEIVLNRLEKYNSEIFRTDQNGTIVFSTNGKELKIDME